ncbi:UNVERIFIED_CONTAM: Aldehyde oxidase GLOX1 [Sesamum radiatum]|uniref:Aldehyde oxidase GLOX1 n=1 Tax=Sesamum radiatum TaxID=300843 RepID=A0AAW2QEE4_SESRA
MFSHAPPVAAHSVEYDVATNSVRPLMVLTDTWCSSGVVMPDGTLAQTGGTMTEIMLRQHNYEFYPKTSSADTSYKLDFLVETKDPKIENNLYPFVFLNVDGNLFIFANNRAILFDYVKGTVVRTYPTIPGGDPRSYPSTGSAVLLSLTDNGAGSAEVLVCGGAPKGAYLSAMNGSFVTALDTCARIRINDPNPEWVMETMPMPRVMGDMVLLPNGNVLIINGAGSGAAGWELGRNPVLAPVIYRPNNPFGSRFEVQSSSTIPRMYHSTALLLRDGRVLVGGSNPHTHYNFTGVVFPTDLSLEAFCPSYLDPNFKNLRPRIVSPTAQTRIGYNQQLTILFTFSDNLSNDASIMVTMVAPAFATHSCSMNQRLIVLSGGNVTKANGSSTYQIRVMTPNSGKIAQPGYYLLFAVHQDVPSEGIWVQIS